jgi:integrase
MNGHVYLPKGRTIWNLKYYERGKPRYESAKTTNKTDALKLLRKRLTAIDSGQAVPRPGQCRIEDGVELVKRDYQVNQRKSFNDVERQLRLHVVPFFAGRYMSAITVEDVNDYVDARLKEGAANATVNNELAALKRAFNLAIYAKKLTTKPRIKRLVTRNARKGFFGRPQLDALCAVLHERLRPVMLLAFYSGWRIRAELLPLTWDRVEEGVMRLDPDTTKNDEGRTFPYRVLPELVELFKVQRAKAKGPYVFHNGRGQRLSHRWYYKQWHAACEAAGLDEKLPHDFRRTAVRELVRKGVPEQTAMVITGHKTRAVFDRYDIVNEADLRHAVAKLA